MPALMQWLCRKQPLELVEGRVPALGVQVPLGAVLEGLLDDGQPGAALDPFEANVDQRLVAALAVLLQPGPGEGDMARPLDRLVNARTDEGAAHAVFQRRTPAAADSYVELVVANAGTFRPPPFQHDVRLREG